jgi:hypothetical protein
MIPYSNGPSGWLNVAGIGITEVQGEEGPRNRKEVGLFRGLAPSIVHFYYLRSDIVLDGVACRAFYDRAPAFEIR